jgi:predicted permease
VSVFIGVALVEFEIDIPIVLHTALDYLSGLCVPLSLLVIGANLSSLSKNFRRPGLDELAVIAGKFALSPLFMALLLSLFRVSGLPFRVLALASTMPCHMQTSINAQYHGVEGEYAARLVSLTTLLCLFTIPAAVALLALLPA